MYKKLKNNTFGKTSKEFPGCNSNSEDTAFAPKSNGNIIIFLIFTKIKNYSVNNIQLVHNSSYLLNEYYNNQGFIRNI